MDPKVAHALVQLMEQVIAKGGTATRASLVGYRVSGKTGTAFKSIAGGYSTDKIMAVFAGLVPASHPKLATVVVIDEPSRDVHEVGILAQGGTVAAPVFASVMSGALRLMDIPPDDLQNVPAATLVQASAPHERLARVAARRNRGGAGQRRSGRGSFDRQPRGASRAACSWRSRAGKSHGLEFAAEAQGARRLRGAMGAGTRHRGSELLGTRVRGPGRRLEQARRPDRRPLLPVAFLAAARRGHHRHQRQDHLRLSAGAGSEPARADGRPTSAPSAGAVSERSKRPRTRRPTR